MLLESWQAIEIIFLFVLGLCVGSFLNVVIYRIGEGKGPRKGFVFGRSFCDHCKKRLKWFDNIPLLSFLILRGRCRNCGQKISRQYPLVEFFTGVLFAFAGWWVFKDCLSSSWCLIETFAYCWVLAGLIAVFVSDLKYRIIPDEVVFSSVAVVLLGRLVGKFWGANLEFPGSFLGSLFSSLGAVLFFLFLIWATKGKGMGMGDVKYVFFMGVLLGWPNILVGLVLAFLTGAVVGVILILIGKKRFGQQVAFGPYLVVATFIAWFWGQQIFNAYLKLL